MHLSAHISSRLVFFCFLLLLLLVFFFTLHICAESLLECAACQILVQIIKPWADLQTGQQTVINGPILNPILLHFIPCMFCCSMDVAYWDAGSQKCLDNAEGPPSVDQKHRKGFPAVNSYSPLKSDCIPHGNSISIKMSFFNDQRISGEVASST